MKKSDDTIPDEVSAENADRVVVRSAGETPPSSRKSSVAKVSHTLSLPLAERLERFAFFQRVSESSVIEHSLREFFAVSDDDAALGDLLRRAGAGRRRKN